jgi:hypothetical protein
MRLEEMKVKEKGGERAVYINSKLHSFFGTY